MASSKRPAAGFSLLEVLVSIVVLSVGLLGAVGMLMTALRSTNESAAFTSAVDLIRDLSEKARINKNVAAKSGAGNAYLAALDISDPLPTSSIACLGKASCTAAQLAAWDMHEWADRVRTTLPEARLSVCFDDALWSANDYSWTCSKTGRNLVVKLGWTPRTGTTAEYDTAKRPPRIVMQLIPGHDYDENIPVGF